MRRRWWAVWLVEYPDEGSMHYLATTASAAKKQARQSYWFAQAEGVELAAARVTAAEHREWLKSSE